MVRTGIGVKVKRFIRMNHPSSGEATEGMKMFQITPVFSKKRKNKPWPIWWLESRLRRKAYLRNQQSQRGKMMFNKAKGNPKVFLLKLILNLNWLLQLWMIATNMRLKFSMINVLSSGGWLVS